MEDQSDNYLDETYELIKKYCNDRLLLIKIRTVRKISLLFSKVVVVVISTILVLFLLLFTSIALGYFFAEKAGNLSYGFGIVAGIYLLLCVFFFLIFKNSISKKTADKITVLFFENNNQFDTLEDEE